MVLTPVLWVRKNYYQVKCCLKDKPSQKIKTVFSFPYFHLLSYLWVVCLFIPYLISCQKHCSPNSRAMHLIFMFTCQQKFSTWYFQIFSCLRCPLFMDFTFKKGVGNRHWGIIFVYFPRKLTGKYHS